MVPSTIVMPLPHRRGHPGPLRGGCGAAPLDRDGAAEDSLAGSPGAHLLTNDPGTGVMRHVDAVYEEAEAYARERGVKIPIDCMICTSPHSSHIMTIDHRVSW